MKRSASLSRSRLIPRRHLLRGLGGATLALPLLESLLPRGEAKAAASDSRKRLVVFFTPNGSLPAGFFGPGDPNNLMLGDILTPLAPHKNDLIIVDHLDNLASMQASGDPHGVGIGCMITGQKLLTGAQAQGMSSGGWAAGISLDQHVANEVGKTTKLRSLELIGKSISGSVFSRMSFAGSGQPVAPEPNPQQAFDRVFGSVGLDAGTQARQIALQKSVLDNVLEELTALGPRLSANDKVKLDAHAAALRDLETRLQTSVNAGGACTLPTRPAVGAAPPIQYDPYAAMDAGAEVINSANDVQFPDIIKSHFDIIAHAFSCDITRVASLMAAPSRSDVVMSWLGLTNAHHEASHMSDAQGAPILTKVNSWYAQQLADFITTLKSIKEGAGTVFDNTVILWCNELAVGNVHSHVRVPFLLAGSAGGYFKTGRYVSFPSGTPHNNLLASVALSMGATLTDNKFGDPNFCTGPLPGLTA